MSAPTLPSLRCPIVQGALGRVKGLLASLAAVAPLTRPARSQVPGNYRSDAISEHAAREIQGTLLFGRPISRFLARFVARSRDLIWRQPDDLAFPPHSNRIAVSFMTLKGVTNGRAKRTPDSIKITSPLDGCRA